MSQLWNIFNTMQILLALPLLAVILPSNIVFIQSIIDQVVNLKIIDDEAMQTFIIAPIFGVKDDSEDPPNTENGTKYSE